MSTGLIYLKPLKVAFVRARGPYAVSSVEAWQRVFAMLRQNGMWRPVLAAYGLLNDDPKTTGAENCRYDACIEVLNGYDSRLPKDFAVGRLPGGVFARTRHSGGSRTLASTITELRDTWTPAHGLVLDPSRPVIEVYLDDPQTLTAEHQRIDICLPVVPIGQDPVDLPEYPEGPE